MVMMMMIKRIINVIKQQHNQTNSVVVDDAGHGAVFDQPEEVNRLVIEFLKSQD